MYLDFGYSVQSRGSQTATIGDNFDGDSGDASPWLSWLDPGVKLKYRTGGQTYNVTLTPGEVRGLELLHGVAARRRPICD